MKFVDIKNDIAFRKIFGNENKKEIVISFLNAVIGLPKGKRIQNVEIKNPFQLPEIKDLKSSILDIRVTDERNISYIVEMQVEEPDGFDKRVQYYTAKQYSAQIDISDDYPKLNQVIFIGILNFKFFEGGDYLTKHLIINQKTGKQELKDIEFNFIELPKFLTKQNELKTLIDKWTFFIKNAPNIDVIPANVDDKGLKHAYEDADKHNWTKEELAAYDYAGMRRQDEKGKTELAVRKAKEEEKIEVAKRMIKANKPIEEIIEFIQLSKQIIEKLIDEMKNSH
jgi:predicted transposase/invertase (TIGR01784 family)